MRSCKSFTVVVALAVLTRISLLGRELGSVRIEALNVTDGLKSVVSASVRNTSPQRIEVNVAVEKLAENQWIEILASITDSKHPYGKTVRLTPIKRGGSLPVSFMPFAKYEPGSPLMPSPGSLSLRLRVDVYGPHGGKVVDTVWSSVFRVSAQPVTQHLH